MICLLTFKIYSKIIHIHDFFYWMIVLTIHTHKIQTLKCPDLLEVMIFQKNKNI